MLKKISKTNSFLLLLSVVLAFVFIFFPEIDIYASSLFYTKDEGFFWYRQPFIWFIYESAYHFGRVTFIVLILLLIAQFFYKKISQYITIKDTLYMIAVLILGVGLIVNWGFKDEWDRARPESIVQFGGDKEFTPAFVISDQCETNCSFVCGHSSFGYFFLAFWFLYKKRWILYSSLGYGTILGIGRIIQGKHFLSDVIFSLVFVYFIAYLFHYLMYKDEYTTPQTPQVDTP